MAMRCDRCLGPITAGGGQSFKLGTWTITTHPDGRREIKHDERTAVCGDCMSDEHAETLAAEASAFLAGH